MLDLSGRAVLITGGTRGIGRAIGLAFGRCGAQVWLTHRWGSANEQELREAFLAVGAPAPQIVEADVASVQDTEALISAIAVRHTSLYAFFSNVCVVSRCGSFEALQQRTLSRVLDYSAWPLVEYVKIIEKKLGAPRYIVATSSDGPEHHYPGYEYVALAKAALESLVRSLASRLTGSQTRVNALRSRLVLTSSYKEMFTEEAQRTLAKFSDFEVSAESIGKAALALASGLLDGMNGQVLTVDKGCAFVDNVLTASSLGGAL
jgi:NAD(P)-dependent dehydrogenase (short-subunit alcohol dehydrogenase family)